jgi:hypothetical protein
VTPLAFEILCAARWRFKESQDPNPLRAMWDVVCAARAEAELALREELGLVPPPAPTPSEPYLLERRSREELLAAMHHASMSYVRQENDE